MASLQLFDELINENDNNIIETIKTDQDPIIDSSTANMDETTGLGCTLGE